MFVRFDFMFNVYNFTIIINNFVYRDVPKYKQRIAGKSLPMEKFAVKKSQRFFNQNNRLFLPAIELLYLWNLFNVFGKRKLLCDNLYRLIDKNTKDLEKNPGTVNNQFICYYYFIFYYDAYNILIKILPHNQTLKLNIN